MAQASQSVFGSSGLCLATVTVPSNLLQRLSKYFTGYAHSFTCAVLVRDGGLGRNQDGVTVVKA
jgi:hypothetical protein